MYKIAFVLLFIVICAFSKQALATCIGLGCKCSLNVIGIAFGVYSTVDPNNTTGNGNVQVTCSASAVNAVVTYQATFSKGNSNSFQRYMLNGGTHMKYNIYNAPSNGDIYGDGTSNTVAINDGYTIPTLAPAVKNYTVYGIIPALQSLPTGSYSDNLTVTLTF
jgi:spore coat protein U-like protein